ncbi:hypothetical protein VA7868_03351 [Vibrio aerogenes CECT 7868]|uniref:Uncharacterized protein n=1 Tax=Vibrio aerogenes CECT 7868 TaxID=1216006 RepID=A0A1M5ZWP4_9VIBR|nr:hypothetical protein [Vibrio aerogenes]SHI28675.1 hypothetical protein VA7868_03351 [Vibrio aerogenes CECT 7868]
MFNQFYNLVPSAFENSFNPQDKDNEAERQRLVQEAQKAAMDETQTENVEMRKCA